MHAISKSISDLHTPAGAQAWRNGARQAQLARALPMIDIRPVAALLAVRSINATIITV